MAKRGSPALYELIRARGPQPAPPSSPVGHGHAPHSGSADEPTDEPLPGGWLRPGRLLRVPLGYVFVVIAAAIVLASLTYIAGYSRGKDESRHLQQEDADLLVSGSGTQSVPRDPLESRPAADSPAAAGMLANRPAAAPDRRPSEWGPIESDPRDRGQYYLMLMTTNRSGAERFVNFARERGLETYMIPANNRFFRVFALPGFEDDKSHAATAFRDEVLRIGRMYREEYRERVNPVEMSEWNRYVARQ